MRSAHVVPAFGLGRGGPDAHPRTATLPVATGAPTVHVGPGRARRAYLAGPAETGPPDYFFLVRVAPPRPRSVTPVSLSTRCTNP
ncbi:hypothetical protein ACFPM0_07820 [Pseudonocardia sulfidoxydans]|uniref:hypothetical protein n=1 Tax=Pseudonocardia sulfidoxydans TaxID=54011 RepID=UPI00361489A1